jgi:hypothetical protein
MIYLLYIVSIPVGLLLTLLAIILSPILPIFATEQEGWLNNGSVIGMGKRLPKWLGWFQTWDNSLEGDATFEAANPPSYWSEVKWLIRNPLPSFALFTLNAPYDASYKGNNAIHDNAGAIAGWMFVKSNGLFQFVWIIPIGFSRCIYINIGWNIRALVDPNVNPKPNPYMATYVFSPRISGFTK